MNPKWARAIFVIVVGAIILAQTLYIMNLEEINNVLIDLNHDKSLYIDNGCKGHYQGTEELMDNEAPPDNEGRQ